MKRLVIAQYIALGATACTVIGVLLGGMSNTGFGFTLMGVGCLLGLVAYLFGGLFTAIKMALGIAKHGFFVTSFPLNLLAVGVTFACALAVFIYLPIIPIRKVYKEKMC